jgi:hypothetical protein
VDDALLRVAQWVQAYAELGAVLAERLDLGTRDRIGDRKEVVGRGVVILRREREVRPAHTATSHAQAIERLRARHFVQQVQVDVEQVRLAVGSAYDVCVPHLLGEGLLSGSHHLDILKFGR